MPLTFSNSGRLCCKDRSLCGKFDDGSGACKHSDGCGRPFPKPATTANRKEKDHDWRNDPRISPETKLKLDRAFRGLLPVEQPLGCPSLNFDPRSSDAAGVATEVAGKLEAFAASLGSMASTITIDTQLTASMETMARELAEMAAALRGEPASVGAASAAVGNARHSVGGLVTNPGTSHAERPLGLPVMRFDPPSRPATNAGAAPAEKPLGIPKMTFDREG